RALVRHVQDPLAERLLDRSLEGGGTLVLRERGDGVVVEALPKPPVAAP
ncbi:MAG: hypothetical protein FJ104_09250, partial [Deltaproteobacteria bacterium]|nr:hypothetical protein [Deltaproteobacteria bacterium]